MTIALAPAPTTRPSVNSLSAAAVRSGAVGETKSGPLLETLGTVVGKPRVIPRLDGSLAVPDYGVFVPELENLTTTLSYCGHSYNTLVEVKRFSTPNGGSVSHKLPASIRDLGWLGHMLNTATMLIYVLEESVRASIYDECVEHWMAEAEAHGVTIVGLPHGGSRSLLVSQLTKNTVTWREAWSLVDSPQPRRLDTLTETELAALYLGAQSRTLGLRE